MIVVIDCCIHVSALAYLNALIFLLIFNLLHKLHYALLNITYNSKLLEF